MLEKKVDEVIVSDLAVSWGYDAQWVSKVLLVPER